MEVRASRTFSKKRTTNFREDETKLLIQLWGSPHIQSKLYLSHRKAPVMKMLALNMQQRGFYRTPDEIKTRIRNLKCLYHRIKRSISQPGNGMIVDPDWPHFKAMDEILTRKNLQCDSPENSDIKLEMEEMDDMDSYTTNSFVGSDCEDLDANVDIKTEPIEPENEPENIPPPQKMIPVLLPNIQEIDTRLRELINVQTEVLEVEKQRLSLEKERINFQNQILENLSGLLKNVVENKS